jgi:outer membrane protein assembly factor BamD
MLKKYKFQWLFVVIIACSCASTSLQEDNNVQYLYDRALANIRSSQYLLALEKLKEVRYKFPYSELAVAALFKVGEVYLLQDDYLEAAATFETFFDLYPQNVLASKALLKAADSYFYTVPSNLERDLTNVIKTQDSYRKFLLRYEHQPEYQADVALAKNKIEELNELLARKELIIGNYYYRQELWDAASGRYEEILAQYYQTKSAKEAKEKLGLIRLRDHKSNEKP